MRNALLDYIKWFDILAKKLVSTSCKIVDTWTSASGKPTGRFVIVNHDIILDQVAA